MALGREKLLIQNTSNSKNNSNFRTSKPFMKFIKKCKILILKL